MKLRCDYRHGTAKAETTKQGSWDTINPSPRHTWRHVLSMGAFNRPWKPLDLNFQAFPDICTRPDDGRVLAGFTSPCSTLGTAKNEAPGDKTQGARHELKTRPTLITRTAGASIGRTRQQGLHRTTNYEKEQAPQPIKQLKKNRRSEIKKKHLRVERWLRCVPPP